MTRQPQLHHVFCPPTPSQAAAGLIQAPRRMAYWDWAAASKQGASHAVVCVHGLSRQGRDFDVLAHHLSDAVRVVCPDVAGRGESDRLAQPMDYQLATYAQDMVALLAQLRTQGVQTIDWVGTSMGGLIGMALAPQPGLGLHRLVLNDVGPAIEAQALQRIGSYLGQAPVFPSADEAIRYLWGISQSFGPHTEQQWRALSEPMLRQSDAGWVLHYDPAIAEPFRALTAESAAVAAAQGEATLWGFYDAIQIPTLLLRGADSDLLSTETARSMGQRGPRARCVEFEGVGHAPTLVVPEQVAVVRSFLLDQP